MKEGKISKSMINGKAFEYSLLNQFYEKLKKECKISIIENSSYFIAKKCFESLGKLEQSENSLTSSFAVNFIKDLEPRLYNSLNSKDILELEILSDDYGKKGDVRDIVTLRKLQDWEIGFSAKNNHKAVKHPRISNTIDFGSKWMNFPCSEVYFKEIKPIFNLLSEIKKESDGKKLWSEIGNYHVSIYKPILNSFLKELKRLNLAHPEAAKHMISYLIGIKDFYKIIKSKNQLEIQAYNMHGSLNSAFNLDESLYKIPILNLPDKIIRAEFEKDSNTTLIVEYNEGWMLSLRIHNASSRVESSLKFDINLIESPKSLFKNIINIQH